MDPDYQIVKGQTLRNLTQGRPSQGPDKLHNAGRGLFIKCTAFYATLSNSRFNQMCKVKRNGYAKALGKGNCFETVLVPDVT